MRVALDTNPLYTTRAGVARYVRGLRQGLAELGEPEITEIAWPVENFDYRQPARAAKTFFRELIWAPFLAPGQLKRANDRHSAFDLGPIDFSTARCSRGSNTP